MDVIPTLVAEDSYPKLMVDIDGNIRPTHPANY
jgi:hypothetical protein